jgi:hypothetical protein
MMDEVAIRIGGVLSALVGIGHCFFYRGFGWKEDFEKTKVVTAKVLYTIHIFVIPILFFFSYASFFHTKDLAGGTPLGAAVTAFYAVFWLLRGLWQIFYFTPSRATGSERLLPLHYFLVVYFVLLCAAYAYPILRRSL